MLVRFIVGNFLSFNERTEFNMLPGAYKRHKHHVLECNKDFSLLKSAAIYGANGAGKSNLVRAIAMLQKIVSSGIWRPEREIAFKNTSGIQRGPFHLEIEFLYESNLLLYGVEIYDEVIFNEWLIKSDIDSKKEEVIFKREVAEEGYTSITITNRYLQSERDWLRKDLYQNELLEINVPLLYLLIKNKENIIKEANIAFQYITDRLKVIFPDSQPLDMIGGFLADSQLFEFANNLMASFETGITSLGLESVDIEYFFGSNETDKVESIKRRLDKGEPMVVVESAGDYVAIEKIDDKYVVKKIVTFHETAAYELDEESDGTKRLLEFMPAFYNVLNHDITYIIDEIDRSIHPALLKQVLTKLLTEDGQFKGQLIFTTHESNLLDFEIFRQDEIWFAEKDKTGATTLFSLSDFDVRADLDWRKGYLNGRFGAIPFLNDLKQLNWHNYGQHTE
ncbi:AAA family ATPase [Chitinophaga japonensis]|uniref:ATPase AAA-type core domain-containing protein n=1 Tax=Chitinophaga japonensis TaxID=104662 RepID=A0A562T4C6_CHIJA|nr:AAA family ATPase [Chitinophaga japonensis]TWI87916.1 hypothetical protein LX66_1990 [Chitinophaga japonensis]